MILIRTPLRVSFAGGGSDLPAWYQRGEAGAVCSAAIGAYIHVTISRHWNPRRIRLSYSRTEDIDDLRYMQHELVREAIHNFDADLTGIEVTTIGQIPGQGTGLGSSSSTTVGIYHALAAHARMSVTPQWLAEAACYTEINLLQGNGGKQDQYAAAYGGINYMRFDPIGHVDVNPIQLSPDELTRMSRTLPLYYTGLHRQARDILEAASERIRNKSHVAAETRAMVGLASQARDAVSDHRLQDLGMIMHESWERKRRLTDRVSHADIDLMYERAIEAGAVGGKLCGAGGGGFFVFQVPEDKLMAVDEALNRRRIHVRYGVPGSEIVYRDEPTF